MGMFSKFWNTNARPEGWLGTFSSADDEPDAYADGTVEPLVYRLPARLDDTRRGVRRWKKHRTYAETLSVGAGLWHRLF